MSNYLASITEVIEKVESNWPRLSHLVVPHLEHEASKYSRSNSLRWCQIDNKFIVDETEFRAYKGLRYLTPVLGAGRNGVMCDEIREIPDRRNIVFDPVASYSEVDIKLRERDSILAELKYLKSQSSNHPADQNDFYKHNFEAKYLAKELLRRDKLEEERIKVEQWFNKATHNGRVKYKPNPYSKNRASVCKCIRFAIAKLIDNPDTRHIGRHLKKHVITRNCCKYTGKWTFIFS